MPVRTLPVPAGLVALMLLCGGPAAATPAPPATGYFLDRLTWNPAGDTLAFLAVPEVADPATEAAPRLIMVEAATGRIAVTAQARAFLASPDGSAALLLGDDGLWWYDIPSGSTRQLYFQSAASPRVVDFAFRRNAPGCLFLAGAPGDRSGALYRYLPPGPPEKLSDHRPGSPPPAAWTAEALPAEPPPVRGTRGARRFTVPGSPPLQFDYDGRTLQVDDGYAGNRTPMEGVTLEWATWPLAGGVALVSVGPLTAGGSAAMPGPRLYSFQPGPRLRLLHEGPAPQAAWLDAGTALFNDDRGALYRYEAAADTIRPLPLDRAPAWARDLAEPARVAVLRVARWPRSARKFEDQEALVKKCARNLPEEERSRAMAYGRRLAGTDRAIGAWSSLGAAEAAAPVFRTAGLDVSPDWQPVRGMNGDFDYGLAESPGGGRAWFRRVAGAPGGSELWLERPGRPAIRLVSKEMN